MEFVSCQHYRAQNFEVAPKFLAKLCSTDSDRLTIKCAIAGNVELNNGTRYLTL
jgi:hypothetical protein